MLIDEMQVKYDQDTLEEAIEAEMDEQAAQVNEEAHYYSVLRDFEQLVLEYGVNRVLDDMDEDILFNIAENANKR